MPGVGRPAARTLALVAAGAIVVAGLAVWWISHLRSLDEESRASAPAPASPPGDLQSLRNQLRTIEEALSRFEREKGIEPAPDAPSDPPRPKEPADQASEAHLRALMRAHESAKQPRDRERILDRFSAAHSVYAETSRDLRFLPFLRGVIATSASERERKCAVIALHGVGEREVVDLLEQLLVDPHAEVRFYAAEALPWVAGPERDRALGLLASSLSNEDPEVRRIAALSLGVVVGDPDHAEPMLRRLEVESDPEVLKGLVFAVRRLLPSDGETRIRELVSRLDRTRADAIDALLR